MKTHIVTETAPTHEPAYLANGLIGLRVPPIPFLPRTGWRMALVNGFSELSEKFSTECYAQAPYPLDVDLGLDGVFLSERPDLARFVEQRYDFSCGELTSRFEFASPAGPTASLAVVTFCCRTLPSVVLQRTTVTVDRACRLTVQGKVEPGGLPGSLELRQRMGGQREAGVDWAARYTGRGGLESLGVASRSTFSDLSAASRCNDWGVEANTLIREYRIDADANRPYELTQWAALVPSGLHGEPHWEAARLVMYAGHHGFEMLREQNAAAWAELWRARPVVLGASDDWQELADAAFFYTHSSIHRAMPASVAPFGLSRQTEYHGHVFWDTEGFIFPGTLLTDPGSARAMLRYRCAKAPAAEAMARLHGQEGLLFPWQSGNRGDEVTTLWGAGEAQHFAGLPVAWAMLQDAHCTGDDLFLRQQAWPVLEGVCRWIVSRTEKTARGYEMRRMRGPDESVAWVDNSGYVNGLSRHVLRESMQLAERLGYRCPPAWRRVAEGMYLPTDADGALLKWDGWAHADGQRCGMEIPPLLHLYGFSMGARADAATMRKYMPLAESYVGMPMN